MSASLTLVSHALCPYVQRVAIVLSEKGVACARRDIDLARKPDWFLALSPTGRTPMLLVDGRPVFESSVICEFLEDSFVPGLHPQGAWDRARHRGWMEYASTVLSAIGTLYSAPDDTALDAAAAALRAHLERVERELGEGPFFAGTVFSMVDAAFAPALRYFEVIDDDAVPGLLAGLPRIDLWRQRLLARHSVRRAVAHDHAARLHAFLVRRDGALGRRLAAAAGGPPAQVAS